MHIKMLLWSRIVLVLYYFWRNRTFFSRKQFSSEEQVRPSRVPFWSSLGVERPNLAQTHCNHLQL